MPYSLVFLFEIFTRHSLLCVLSCGWDLSLKFVPQNLQWIFFSSLPQLKGRLVSVWICLIIFLLNTRPFELIFVAFRPKFYWDSSIRFQKEIIFGKCSRNFLQSKALLFPDLRNFCHVSTILFWVHIVLKSFENTYTSTFTRLLYPFKEVRPKWKHRIRYKEEKPGCFVFWKTSFPVLFTLGPRLITPYSLGVVIWCFYQTLLIVCIEVWLTFELEMPSTIFAMIFFIHHCHDRKEGLFLFEIFLSFSNWIFVWLSWNFPRFIPNFVGSLP